MKSLLVIGGGPGGYETAVRAASSGLEVTLVTSGPLGGTCLNAGCIPTKCLCHSAEQASVLHSMGVDLPEDFLEKTWSHKRETVQRLRDGVASLLKNVRVIYGTASFVDRDAVKVVLSEQEAGSQIVEGLDSEQKELLLTADAIVIATGSESASLPIPGADLPAVLDSTALLNLEQVPESLAIVGGGVIGLEFASVFAALGSKVTVLEYCKDLLPRFDTDLAKRLKQALSKRGIDIITQAQLTEIRAVGKLNLNSDASETASEESTELELSYLCKGAQSSIRAEKLLMAVGRKPRYEQLNLQAAGVEVGRRGIVVDENMLTSNPKIYAIGDVNGLMMLAHSAIAQGKIALGNMLSTTTTVRSEITPAAVFTVPEVATVGLTEEECKEKQIAFKTVKSFYRANGKALAIDQSDGFCKLLVSAEDERVLGCHLMGAHASDLIAEIAALMYFDATLKDMDSIIHAHPTLSEILVGGI